MEQQRQKRRGSLWVKFGSSAAVAIFIFAFGVGVGKGTISFGSNQSTQNGSLPNNLDYSSVEQVYDTIRQDYDGKLDANKLLDGIKKGLANATGDPYTQYFTADEAKTFNDQIHGAFSGIGAEIEKSADGSLTVVSPIAGSPAEKAGLQARDVIVSIDKTDTSTLSIDEALAKIRGAKGTQVTLQILRNKTDTLTLTITRDDIVVPSVTWKELDGNVGLITISRFDDSADNPSDSTSALAAKAAAEFKSKNVKSVLVDLRNDPGGVRDEAINVASLWLTPGTLVMQEKHNGVVTNTFNAKGDPTLKGMPTAVLINGGSASASEILAGALHDNNAATLVGEKSYGKGVVQEVIPGLPGGAELKITAAHWFRPNGENIDGKGIQPDKPATLTAADVAAQCDPQKDAALSFLQGRQ